MAQYKILHGNFKTKDGFVGFGQKKADGSPNDVVEFSDLEFNADPEHKKNLKLKEAWDIEQDAEKAKADRLAQLASSRPIQPDIEARAEAAVEGDKAKLQAHPAHAEAVKPRGSK